MRKLTKKEKRNYPQFKSKRVRLIRPLLTPKGNKSKYYLTAEGNTVVEAMLRLETKQHPVSVSKALKRGYLPDETCIY